MSEIKAGTDHRLWRTATPTPEPGLDRCAG